jgi:hypothetical protein
VDALGVNLTPASYQIPSGWGITFYLNAVQKVKTGEKFAGTASSPKICLKHLL